MKRTYCPKAKRALKQLFRNAIHAIDAGYVNDAGDLGLIADELEQIAMHCEDAPDDETSLRFRECGGNDDLMDILRQKVWPNYAVVSEETPKAEAV